jgi:hypothetical protein
MLKLVDVMGDVLGTILVPNEWAAELGSSPHRRIPRHHVISKPMALYGLGSNSMPPEGGEIREFSITIADPLSAGAVQIYGITLIDFEKIPGCAFMPGALFLTKGSRS